VLVEHARNVLGIADAVHAESSSDEGTPIVTALACSLEGVTIVVELTPGTTLARLHGDATTVAERTTCNYGLDPQHQWIASSGGLVVSGVDATGEVRAVERDDHPFFLATLYQPQLRSTPDEPHPVWLGFVAACAAAGASGGGRQ
jgi:CTP synthase (UTP-ammonia lyase)